MENLTFYESSSNVQNDKLRQSIKINGQFNFKIPANKSGKCIIKFPQQFTSLPNLNVCVSVNDGNALDVKHAIEGLNKEQFIIHLCNSDVSNEVGGTVVWFSHNN